MVFKNPIHLARSGFAKTFAHYPQSLVAATQSSGASQNHPFANFGNVYGLLKSQHPLHSVGHNNNGQHNASASSSSAGVKASAADPNGSDSGLAAYYAAWARHHNKKEEKEWHQFQFAKRIGWKAPTTILESHLRPVEPSQTDSAKPSRPTVERAHTADALEYAADRGLALADSGNRVDASTTRSIEERSASSDPSLTTEPTTSKDPETTRSRSNSASESYSPTDRATTPATSTFSASDAYTEQLTNLAEAQRYHEIPPVFESMLKHSVVPSPSAYNALLLAAIGLTKGQHCIVPKALEVYSDMLRRRVSPDTTTYAILIELLAARSLDVLAMDKELETKHLRYGSGKQQFKSDEIEGEILREDDSLDNAIKLFDTSAAVSSSHVFSDETYRLLITACAESNRVDDMVRIYANMESAGVVPPSAVFGPMIQAFAHTGDLRSSVDCYEEYSRLAVSHNNGTLSIVRKDEEVYAALIKAYLICDRESGGLKFLGKIEDSLPPKSLKHVRQTVAMHALFPDWLSRGLHARAIDYASTTLSNEARVHALEVICIDAADKNNTEASQQAYTLLQSLTTIQNGNVLAAFVAMHLRVGSIAEAAPFFQAMMQASATNDLPDVALMYSQSLIGVGMAQQGLQASRRAFANLRSTAVDVKDKVQECVNVLASNAVAATTVLEPAVSVELLRIMIENDSLMTAVAQQALASIGPQELRVLPVTDVVLVAYVEAGLLIGNPVPQTDHIARFGDALEVAMSLGAAFDPAAKSIIEQVLVQIDQPRLNGLWTAFQQTSASYGTPPSISKAINSPVVSPTADSWDPYLASTDFKGSAFIAEELDKTHGKPSMHLNEALAKFRNIRRAGRHPRYMIYSKLIGAAAKENRLAVAHDILAMAKQDVPYVPNSLAVHQGWVSILDAMTAASITSGQRDQAENFHKDLLAIGAAPSANTFGLYITTLKESTKTFDEATEAVKIFHQAKAEGVEPTSFLYNALIGKLGKARRIDDCLFYFTEMRNLGIRPTSVTYGTIVNALCRVSDDKFAEELFEEMESMPNYKPRPAPYNSLMQHFLVTKRDRSKVLAYYERMKSNGIKPTMHTYKLLIDCHATLEPVNMQAAEALLAEIPSTLGAEPEAVHYASLIHAKGCVQHDVEASREMFEQIIKSGKVIPQACLFQALFESLVANHRVADTEAFLAQMKRFGVRVTPYIANSLIHGWAMAGDVSKANQIFHDLGKDNREPSTYEAMTRAWLTAGEHGQAMRVVGEMLNRGYPSAVANKITEIVSAHVSN